MENDTPFSAGRLFSVHYSCLTHLGKTTNNEIRATLDESHSLGMKIKATRTVGHKCAKVALWIPIMWCEQYYFSSPYTEIHPVAFSSCTLSTSKLNYDTHDKELLAIFDAFKKWWHYLEGSGSLIDVVTDHKNLEYFSTTKLWTHCQALWLEFLSQCHLTIHFHPGKIGTKPDTLNRQWNIYPKEGDSDYTKINPQNLRLVFTQEEGGLCDTWYINS